MPEMISRTELMLLSILNKEEAVNPCSVITLREILEVNKICHRNTAFDKLENLIKLGFVDYGVKDGKAFTYYITKKGRDFLKESNKVEE